MSLQSTFDWTMPAGLHERALQVVWPVWNNEQRRLRGPVRAVLPTVLTFIVLALLQNAIRARFSHPVREILEMTGMGIVLVSAILLSAYIIDRRHIRAFGLSFDREWWHSFAVGGIVATVINGGALAVSLAAGWATVTGVTQGSGDLPFLPAMGVVFGYIALAAAWEEFTMRAAMVKNLSEGADGFLPQWAAIGIGIVVSTVIFAFLHGGKVTHPSQYGYYLIAGLILSIVYVLTGELALAVGFHAFYNFTQSAIFGLGHSQQTPELLVVDIIGPSYWVGEEGLVFVMFAIFGGLLLIVYIRWRDGSLELDSSITTYTSR